MFFSIFETVDLTDGPRAETSSIALWKSENSDIERPGSSGLNGPEILAQDLEIQVTSTYRRKSVL